MIHFNFFRQIMEKYGRYGKTKVIWSEREQMIKSMFKKINFFKLHKVYRYFFNRIFLQYFFT